MTDQLPDVPGGAHRRTVAFPATQTPAATASANDPVADDLASGTSAAAHSAKRVVTVRIDAVEVLKPVSVRNNARVLCELEDGCDTSVSVKIEVWARGRTGDKPQEVTAGVFRSVAFGEDRKQIAAGRADFRVQSAARRLSKKMPIMAQGVSS